MVLELKDGIYNSFENAIVFSIYSNNKTFVSSYVSIFESLWRYIDLLEKFKEIDKKHKIQEADLEKSNRTKNSVFIKN